MTAEVVPGRRAGADPVDSSDTARATTVAVSALVAIVAAAIGSGAIVGTPINQAAGGALSASSTLVAPGGSAFSIWSVIYAGLVALAGYQLVGVQRRDPRERRVGWWVAGSLLLNAAWILIVQAGSVWASAVVIVALLAVLVIAFVRLLRSRPTSPLQALLLDGVIGLYLGWVAIATVANLAALLVTTGLPATGLLASLLAVLVLLVAAGIGVGIAVAGHGRFAPALSLGWGLAWIAVARWTGEPRSATTSVVAVLAAVVVVGSAVLTRIRRPHLRHR